MVLIMDNDKQILVDIQQISGLLQETIDLYREDRELAKANYQSLRGQLDDVLDMGLEMSEEGALEKAVNGALKLYMDSGRRLEKAVETLAKIFTNQVNANTKLLVADKLVDGQSKIQKPVDFKSLTRD